MSLHIDAAQDRIAPTVLMPGDPLRARWAAQSFLSDPVQINARRGMLGYTGRWNGAPVTIMGSGMGMPSLSIYVSELFTEYDVQRVIRIGSAGAMQPQVALGSLVIAMTASSLSTPSAGLLGGVNVAPCADWGLLRAAVAAAEEIGVAPHIGGIYSSNTFHDEHPDTFDVLKRHGVLAVEMETAELYYLAARHGRRALALLTVSDHLVTGEQMHPDQRETGFESMVRVALKCAFPEAG